MNLMTRCRAGFGSAALGAVGVLLAGSPAGAVTLTNQTPNIDTVMTTPVGAVYFPFTHRFTLDGGKVNNSPTFTLSTGLTSWADLEARYATNSDVNGDFNEWEALAKAHWGPADQPMGLSFLAGYNGASSSIDGSVIGAYDVGPLGLRGTLRAFSNAYGVKSAAGAGGLGLIWHLNKLVALDADINDLLIGDFTSIGPQTNGLRAAWSVAIVGDLPYTPHGMSLYVTNGNTHTLEGMSRGAEALHYGFEFMIPFSNFGRYSAWLGHGLTPTPVVEKPPVPETPVHVKGETKDVTIAQFKFGPADLTITPGTTVLWTNQDTIAHSASADDGSWDTGLLANGASASHTFDQPGDYPYHCAPHPFMKATIHVK